jgi:hypothetical protein
MMRGGTNGVDVTLNIFNGGRGLSDEEINLGMPDDSEAKNLKHHTAKCALRFKLFSKKLGEHGEDVQQVKLLLITIGGYLVLVSEPAKNIVEFLLKRLIGG